ncbi:charged multivesicular body protein 5 [Dorcoceras hygrometricum]|uniref:Charged multivesicular body protein 5 n=1 Tax=Dorcoceras hygrometricum TaxID=472368 RepID=A0A2Z7DDZ1_9LAMI|nr:charged multivesicular body protein 5 [Dorcoceras hygrometricum]
MRRLFGAKKEKEPQPSHQESTDNMSKRGDTIDEKIKKLDAELARYKDQIKKTRPGPAQEAIKARATRVLKQKRVYKSQRDLLFNQTFNLDQVAFAADGIKDSQQTVCSRDLLFAIFSIMTPCQNLYSVHSPSPMVFARAEALLFNFLTYALRNWNVIDIYIIYCGVNVSTTLIYSSAA